MILPFRWMKNFSSKWLKELENVESGHPNDGCTTVTIPNCRMDKFSPPDVLAPALCHLLRLPPQLPGQLAQVFTIADRVFVCSCCLFELSQVKKNTYISSNLPPQPAKSQLSPKVLAQLSPPSPKSFWSSHSIFAAWNFGYENEIPRLSDISFETQTFGYQF